MNSTDEIRLRAERGEALFAQDLAVVLGYSYSAIKMMKREGMPFFKGKITLARANGWIDEQSKKEAGR